MSGSLSGAKCHGCFPKQPLPNWASNKFCSIFPFSWKEGQLLSRTMHIWRLKSCFCLLNPRVAPLLVCSQVRHQHETPQITIARHRNRTHLATKTWPIQHRRQVSGERWENRWAKALKATPSGHFWISYHWPWAIFFIYRVGVCVYINIHMTGMYPWCLNQLKWWA